MANGKISSSDGGYVIDVPDDWVYAEIGYRLPLQPLHWADTIPNRRMKVEYSMQHTVAATDTLSERMINPNTELATDSSGSAEWFVFDTITSPSGQVVTPCSEVTPDSTAPKHRRTHMQATSNTRSSEVLMIGVEHVTSIDYGDGDPAIDGVLETIGRGSTWKPYGKQRPVSAWLLRRVLADTLNKTAFESRQLWSTPL